MSLVKWARPLLLLLSLICGSMTAWGALYLEVRENLRIYEKPRPGAAVVGELRAGEQVVHTGRRNRDYLEIIQSGGKGGFVRRADMVRSRITDNVVPKVQRPKSSWGLGVGYSSYLQEDRAVQTATDTYYDASKFSGSAPLYFLYYEHQVSQKWSTIASLGKRQLVMEGDAVLRGGLPGSFSRFRLTQEFLSFGFGLKLYINQKFWLSGHFELAKGTAVHLDVIEGTPISSEGLEKPFFTVGTGGLGYDVYWNSFRFQPQLRAGVIPFADPFIVAVEALLTADRSF